MRRQKKRFRKRIVHQSLDCGRRRRRRYFRRRRKRERKMASIIAFYRLDRRSPRFPRLRGRGLPHRPTDPYHFHPGRLYGPKRHLRFLCRRRQSILHPNRPPRSYHTRPRGPYHFRPGRPSSLYRHLRRCVCRLRYGILQPNRPNGLSFFPGGNNAITFIFMDVDITVSGVGGIFIRGLRLLRRAR